MQRILIAGGAGFMGSHFARHLLERYPGCEVIALDRLMRAENLDRIEPLRGNPRFHFLHGDICDAAAVQAAMSGCQAVVNLAGESVWDQSLVEPGRFLQSDIAGTHLLLEAALREGVSRFVLPSSDTVYGPCPAGAFRENAPLRPSEPLAASKAGAEMLARAYHEAFGLPVVVTRGAETFGPYQHPEALLPMLITNALEDQPLPLSGGGTQPRDRVFVGDHCEALDTVMRLGVPGEVYNVGSGELRSDLELVRRVLDLLGKPRHLVRHMLDDPVQERRRALDTSRLRALGWEPRARLECALAETVTWYAKNAWWWKKLKAEESTEYCRALAGTWAA